MFIKITFFFVSAFLESFWNFGKIVNFDWQIFENFKDCVNMHKMASNFYKNKIIWFFSIFRSFWNFEKKANFGQNNKGPFHHFWQNLRFLWKFQRLGKYAQNGFKCSKDKFLWFLSNFQILKKLSIFTKMIRDIFYHFWQNWRFFWKFHSDYTWEAVRWWSKIPKTQISNVLLPW